MKLTKKQREMKAINEMCDLEAHLAIIYTAWCENCNRHISSNRDSFDFSEELHKSGWRMFDGEMHCPDCYKQHIINHL